MAFVDTVFTNVSSVDYATADVTLSQAGSGWLWTGGSNGGTIAITAPAGSSNPPFVPVKIDINSLTFTIISGSASGLVIGALVADASGTIYPLAPSSGILFPSGGFIVFPEFAPGSPPASISGSFDATNFPGPWFGLLTVQYSAPSSDFQWELSGSIRTTFTLPVAVSEFADASCFTAASVAPIAKRQYRCLEVTSDGGASWTTVPHPLDAEGEALTGGYTSAGIGTLAAGSGVVISTAGAAAIDPSYPGFFYSPDGVTWSTSPSAGTGFYRGIWVPWAGLFLVETPSGNIYYSTDGVNWTSVAGALGYPITGGFDFSPILVAIGAFGGSGTEASADGVNWTAYSGPSGAVAYSPTLGLWAKVAWSFGSPVGGPAGIAIFTASDPRGTWTPQTDNPFNNAPGTDLFGAGLDIVWSSFIGAFVAIGVLGPVNTNNPFVWVSTNGTHWTSGTLPGQLVNSQDLPILFARSDGVYLSGIVVGNVATKLLRSTDGATWTTFLAPDGLNGLVYAVLEIGSEMFVGGTQTIFDGYASAPPTSAICSRPGPFVIPSVSGTNPTPDPVSAF